MINHSIKKILYIQHASTLGGSCMSLLYTIQGLNRVHYKPILVLANDKKSVINFYKSKGFKAITCPEITIWNHSTAIASRPFYKMVSLIETIKIARSWEIGKKKTLELVKLVKPDLVHLNSVVLSASAVALAQEKIPFVWHIREHPIKGFLGVRTNIIRRLMLSCPDEIIFLSGADCQAWVGGKRGQVIPNFIDFAQFDRFINGKHIRKELGIPTNASVILYVGGLREIKGIFPLLKALSNLKKCLPQLFCLMPGGEYNPPNYWKLNFARKFLPVIGSGTVGQRVEKDITKFGLNKVCIRLPFQKNIAPLIAACDVLVFPAIKPHFARPAIEASAMAKPVIASRLTGIEELIQNNKTGVLVEPNDSESLTKSLYDILTDKVKAKQMGGAGYLYAKEKFSIENNCNKVMEIYDRILKKNSTHKNTYRLKNSNNSLFVKGKYFMEPLLTVRKDDIYSMLGPKPGVYICDCPESEWYKHFGFKQLRNNSFKKKYLMFQQMAKESKWISPTSDVPKGKSTEIWKSENILHLAYRSLPCRLGQFLQTISLFGWLLHHRREYDYCLVYNFCMPYYLAPLIVKILLGKSLYIDYEDDYTKQRKNFLKNDVEIIMRKTVTGAICINKYMTRYFVGKPVRVLNCFANLEYTESANFNIRSNMTFLFGSTLDTIRGVDLIPDLVCELRKHIKNFKIFITGIGPLWQLVESWNYPEVKYLGFLNDVDYTNVIKLVDACLVLQKPDHLFSIGSFPSKIDEYAEHNKPIFILKLKGE